MARTKPRRRTIADVPRPLVDDVDSGTGHGVDAQSTPHVSDNGLGSAVKQTGTKWMGTSFPGPGPGRPAGGFNRFSKTIRDDILAGAVAHGFDGSGSDGLRGYMRFLAAKKPRLYVQLVLALIPRSVNVKSTTTAEIIALLNSPSTPMIDATPTETSWRTQMARSDIDGVGDG